LQIAFSPGANPRQERRINRQERKGGVLAIQWFSEEQLTAKSAKNAKGGGGLEITMWLITFFSSRALKLIPGSLILSLPLSWRPLCPWRFNGSVKSN
jgi:hypothetical protein